jgi:cytochrome c oxidase subunit 2
MKNPKWIPALVGLAFVAAAVLAQQPAPAQSGEPRKISVTAKKYEFTPSKIELKVGEPAVLEITAEDTTHGFTCKDLGVDKVIIEKGKTETVKITPEKAGNYEFKCAKWCGFGHGKMKGEIVVTAAEPSRN